MIYKFLKSTTLKLLLLAFTVLITLIVSVFLFNSQIDRLKQQIDSFYFGNLIPIVKLQIITDMRHDTFQNDNGTVHHNTEVDSA